MSTSEAATSPRPAPVHGLRGRTFVSSAVTDHGTPRPLVAGSSITLTFDADVLRAEAACNTLQFPVQVEPDRLVVGDDVASTLMACSEARGSTRVTLTGTPAATS